MLNSPKLLLLLAGYFFDSVSGQKCKIFNPSGPLSAKTSGPIINVPLNYNLSFNIRPTAISPGWGSIVHFSANQQDNSRVPAIWFAPGTNTFVSLIVYRNSVQLYLNGLLSQEFTTTGWRISGNATLYTSDSWYGPALATMDGLTLRPYSDQLAPNLAQVTKPESVFVPVNYQLSFNITPLAIGGGWGSIVHYSSNQQDTSRIPAFWFAPGTTQLYCRFSTNQHWDEGFTSKALPLGSTTSVSLLVYRSSIQLYLNGSLSQEFTTAGMRIFGQASLYMSDPWYGTAIARVDGYALAPYKDQNVTGCEATPPLLQCPKGQKLTKASIQYGRWDNTICPHPTVSASTAPRTLVAPLPARCDGLETCQLGALNGEFGDLYPNVYKHFMASVTCA